MTRVRTVLFLVALAIVTALAVACGGDDSDDGGGAGVLEIDVRMTDDVTFEPESITVEAGRPVRLVAENASGSLHDFTVANIPVSGVESSGAGGGGMGHGASDSEEFDLHIALEAGATGTLEFTPTEAGEYSFVCTVTGHEAAGMVGRLIVESGDL